VVKKAPNRKDLPPSKTLILHLLSAPCLRYYTQVKCGTHPFTWDIGLSAWGELLETGCFPIFVGFVKEICCAFQKVKVIASAKRGGFLEEIDMLVYWRVV